MNQLTLSFFAAGLIGAAAFPGVQADEKQPLTAVAADAAPKPLRALLVIGGCCHDYGKQKEILKAGIEERANVIVDVEYNSDKGTRARFPAYEKPNWAAEYDVVIHDECSAEVKDTLYVENILNAHKNGVPAVNLHCAMHCYRTGTPVWFEFIGLQSSAHGPQEPIEITFVDAGHPITKGLENWTTIKEELYNNLKVFDGAHALARGRQGRGRQARAEMIPWSSGRTNTARKKPACSARRSDTTTRPSPTTATSTSWPADCFGPAANSTTTENQRPASGR